MFVRTILLFVVIVSTWEASAHQTVASTSDYSTTNDGGTTEDQLPITDPRFFTHKIFNKYGEGSNIPFEGFEHLMENLGLGNIDIKDHDLQSHKEDDNEFRIMHDSHEHSKEPREPVAPETKEVATDGSHNTVRRAHKLPAPNSNHNHDHDHSNHDHDAGRITRNDGNPGSSTHVHANDDRKHEYSTSGQPYVTSTHENEPHVHEHQDSVYHDDHDPLDHYEPQRPFPELLDARFSVVENHHYSPDASQEMMFKQRCLSPRDILETFHFNPNASLNTVKFLLICPAIIWELDQQHCVHRHQQESYKESVTMDQWVYSSLAVVMISLCGLFSVAVIPIMQKWFYHTLLQFLVGLAVGSLSGDALLHLLPHAMLPSEDNHRHSGNEMNMEEAAVWKGMSALGGIYFFFIAERVLNALSSYRRQKKAKAQLTRRSQDTIPAQDIEDSNIGVGEKLSHYRRNSYGMKVGPDGKEMMQMLPYVEEPPSCRDSRRSSTHEMAFHGRSSFTADPHSDPLYYAAPPSSESENYVVTMNEHHGHGHGHSHEVPQSVSAVAWMVIMGDGLHNFCDGMAIGAAFASGLAGGISTTVAVFCHELPHELGDFAMLLKTGMKVKQALMYNGLSSVLCFIGMVIGLSLGSVHSTTSWIFAATAGMFIYIAFVDMLPELSMQSEDPRSTPSYTLAVQVFGISIGVSVMLLIANYEHELVKLVS